MIRSAPASRAPITAPRPTRPQPNTAHVEPGWTRGGVERRADPGREAARERRAAVERRLRAHLRERDLGHDGVLREGRGAHEVPQRLAAARQARRPVGEVAEPLLVADRDAAVRPRAAAVNALAALRREQRDHVVAGRDERHARADRLDDARALVPEHARRVAGRVGARRGVQIGVADAARGQPDERLTGLRLREVDLLDDERLPELLENSGADLHRDSSDTMRESLVSSPSTERSTK